MMQTQLNTCCIFTKKMRINTKLNKFLKKLKKFMENNIKLTKFYMTMFWKMKKIINNLMMLLNLKKFLNKINIFLKFQQNVYNLKQKIVLFLLIVNLIHKEQLKKKKKILNKNNNNNIINIIMS